MSGWVRNFMVLGLTLEYGRSTCSEYQNFAEPGHATLPACSSTKKLSSCYQTVPSKRMLCFSLPSIQGTSWRWSRCVFLGRPKVPIVDFVCLLSLLRLDDWRGTSQHFQIIHRTYESSRSSKNIHIPGLESPSLNIGHIACHGSCLVWR